MACSGKRESPQGDALGANRALPLVCRRATGPCLVDAFENEQLGHCDWVDRIDELIAENLRVCTALAGGEGARTYRDRWREQLNRNVARKLGRLGG